MFLSIITFGRNDKFAGNFIHRLKLNLTKLIDNIIRLDRTDIEIIVTDWGSPEPDNLKNAININHESLKYIHVPENITEKYSPDSEFSVPHAANTAIRRSTGEYILIIDGDAYIPIESLNGILTLLENSNSYVYYWASRYMIPYRLQNELETIHDMDLMLRYWELMDCPYYTVNTPGIEKLNGFFYERINFNNFGGSAIGILLDRNIIEESTFFYEALNKWGWMDIEYYRRLQPKYPCKGDLELILNSKFYHIGHHNVGTGHGTHGSNPWVPAPKFKANSDEWGLINENLKIE